MDKAPRRSPRARAWEAGLLALALAAGNAAAAPFTKGPPPAWVTAVAEPVPRDAPKNPPSGGTRWVLLDQQIRMAHGTTSEFRHRLVQAVDARGLDKATHVDISFDPSYQSLALHTVRVWRDGNARSQLDTLDARVLQREPDLAARIYDGRLTVSLLLRDVRPGDAVEVAYTLTGSNPVFAGHRFGDLGLQAGVPVDRLRERLLVDGDAPLALRPRNHAPALAQTRTGGLRDLVWEARGVAALAAEENTPSRWDGAAAVGYTDFPDWAALVRWALPLYTPPARFGAELQAERDALAAAHASPEERVVAALRLVQAQVRYLGIEMGASSHAPAAPDAVFARRYGDCKEKTLLLAALLRSLGIDASPALVNTERHDAIAEDLPSPTSFDHVVTRVRLGGRTFWLDATRSPQAGDLAHLAQSHYGRALVVAPDSAGLETMAPPIPADDLVDERMSLDLRHADKADAGLQVVAVHHGAAAESMRRQIADDGLERLQRDYLGYYADEWKGIRVAAPMEVRDDAVANALTVTEHYAVPDAWQASPESGGAHARISPDEVFSWLARPSRAARTAPLALGAPRQRLLRIDVDLPVSRERIHDRRHVESPQFAYERSVDGDGSHLRFDYSFVRSAEELPPAGVAAHADKVDEARRWVSWRIVDTPGFFETKGRRLILPGLVIAFFGWRLVGHWRTWRAAAAPDAVALPAAVVAPDAVATPEAIVAPETAATPEPAAVPKAVAADGV